MKKQLLAGLILVGVLGISGAAFASPKEISKMEFIFRKEMIAQVPQQPQTPPPPPPSGNQRPPMPSRDIRGQQPPEPPREHRNQQQMNHPELYDQQGQRPPVSHDKNFERRF